MSSYVTGRSVLSDTTTQTTTTTTTAISAEDFNNALAPLEPEGNTLEDSIQVCKWLEEAGVDALHVSSGSSFPHPRNPPGEFPVEDALKTFDSMISSGDHTFRNYLIFKFWPFNAIFRWLWRRPSSSGIEGINLGDCRKIKEAVSVPVICTGGFQTASVVAAAIERGDCDGVTIGRPLIANHDLVQLWQAGHDRPPKPCTYSNKCLINQIENPLGCYEESRFDNDREKMLAQVMSVFSPPPFH